VTFYTLVQSHGALVLPAVDASDPQAYAAGQGHPAYPCLSRSHNPTSCVPCTDFSPWLRERVRIGDTAAVGEYLWRVREANPGAGASAEQLRDQFHGLARAILAAPLSRHLEAATPGAYLDLQVALILLAVHEVFSGFIMTGEAADFLASVMAPHALALRGGDKLVDRRNAFVQDMAQEMSYWSGWSMLPFDALRWPVPPPDLALQAVLAALRPLPLGTRAHAVDALRHLSADAGKPRTLASLSRYESRKRGLDVAESTYRILESGLLAPASDLRGWLAGWTRRDLLAFLVQAGLRPKNSWSKGRLAEVAEAECEELVRARMADSGAVELDSSQVEGARALKEYLDGIRETWRVWLGFGTGIETASAEC
jgi:hypothetical protein